MWIFPVRLAYRRFQEKLPQITIWALLLQLFHCLMCYWIWIPFEFSWLTSFSARRPRWSGSPFCIKPQNRLDENVDFNYCADAQTITVTSAGSAGRATGPDRWIFFTSSICTYFVEISYSTWRAYLDIHLVFSVLDWMGYVISFRAYRKHTSLGIISSPFECVVSLLVQLVYRGWALLWEVRMDEKKREFSLRNKKF